MAPSIRMDLAAGGALAELRQRLVFAAVTNISHCLNFVKTENPSPLPAVGAAAYWFTCTTLAGAKPLNQVEEAWL